MANTYNQTSYDSLIWEPVSRGHIGTLSNPVIGGHDVNGESIYVGRALHGQDCIPGKIVPSHRVCYVSYDGREHAHPEYQILKNPGNIDLIWMRASDGKTHAGSVEAGEQANGEKLYIGRAAHGGSLVVGKVHPSHGVCYVPFAGNEVVKRQYEVLLIDDVDFSRYILNDVIDR